MKRKNSYLKISFLITISLFFLAGCSELNQMGESGFLKGKISIGPICPVETVPPLPQCQPTAETYKAWQTSVWNQKKTRIISDIEPELDGTFYLKLSAGKYVVDFKNTQTNGIGSNNLPVEITIVSADTTTVNIDIDTGIR
ncbi:MAG TPA: hypothetical protein VFK73_04800 [Paludibacter sp.]|nr:hypothetical protein [Paludibacter sp.]